MFESSEGGSVDVLDAPDAATEVCAAAPADAVAGWDGVSFAEDGKPVGWDEMGVSQRDRIIDQLTDRARSAAAAVTRAEAELVAAVRVLEPIMGRVYGGLGPWVGWQCGLTPAEASRTIKLARRLPDLPMIDTAFQNGTHSAGTIASMARVATPENQAQILDVAQVATGAQLQKLLAEFRKIKPRPTDPEDDPATRKSFLDKWWDGDGRLQGRLDLDPVDGAMFEAALDSRRTDSAKALHDQIEAGELRPEETAGITSAEALAQICEDALGMTADADGLVPETNQIIARLDHDTGQATLDGSGAIPPAVLAYLVCQSMWYVIGFAGMKPVTQTTRQRFFTGTQRRALLARDKTCQYPGCGRHRRLHAHHNDEFHESKITNLDDGLLLCPKHHRLVHRMGHRLTRDERGAVTVHRRDGTTLVSRPPPPDLPEPGPAPPANTRATGTHDRLTPDASDSVLHAWAHATNGMTPLGP